MPPLILEMRYLTHSAAVPPLLRLRPKLGDDPGSPGYIFAEPGWATGCRGREAGAGGNVTIMVL